MLAFNNVSFHPHFLRSFLLSVKRKSMAPRELRNHLNIRRNGRWKSRRASARASSFALPAAKYPS